MNHQLKVSVSAHSPGNVSCPEQRKEWLREGSASQSSLIKLNRKVNRFVEIAPAAEDKHRVNVEVVQLAKRSDIPPVIYVKSQQDLIK